MGHITIKFEFAYNSIVIASNHLVNGQLISQFLFSKFHMKPSLINRQINSKPKQFVSEENVRVLIRVRPINDFEARKGDNPSVRITDGKTVTVDTPSDGPTSFKFDNCLDSSCNQEQMFQDSGVQQLIHDTLQGYHTTLFAFGQTGAGKTYTMIGGDYGNEASLGIMPRALQYLYFIVGSPALAEFKYSFRINCLEIYNENVFDLFVDEQQRKTSLPVREHSEHGFFVEGCRIVPCERAEDAIQALDWALTHRHVASHDMNERSSRSHCLVSVFVDGRHSSGSTINGRMTFVDLAGSER